MKPFCRMACAKAFRRSIKPVHQHARLVQPGNRLAQQAVAPHGVAALRRFLQEGCRVIPQVLRLAGAVVVTHARAAAAVTAKT